MAGDDSENRLVSSSAQVASQASQVYMRKLSAAQYKKCTFSPKYIKKMWGFLIMLE